MHTKHLQCYMPQLGELDAYKDVIFLLEKACEHPCTLAPPRPLSYSFPLVLPTYLPSYLPSLPPSLPRSLARSLPTSIPHNYDSAPYFEGWIANDAC